MQWNNLIVSIATDMQCHTTLEINVTWGLLTVKEAFVETIKFSGEDLMLFDEDRQIPCFVWNTSDPCRSICLVLTKSFGKSVSRVGCWTGPYV